MAQGYKNLKHKQLVKSRVSSEDYYKPKNADRFGAKDEAMFAREDAAGEKGVKDARRHASAKYGVHPSKLAHVGTSLKGGDYDEFPDAEHKFRIR